MSGFWVAGDHPVQHGPSVPSLSVSETAVKVLEVTQGPIFHAIPCMRWWFSEGLVSICCWCRHLAELMKRIFVLPPVEWNWLFGSNCTKLDLQIQIMQQCFLPSWPIVSARVSLLRCPKDKPTDVSEECNREASQGKLTMEGASCDVCVCV